jgi:hypothetical protein
MILIPKLGKNKTASAALTTPTIKKQNFRPVSLMNIHAKILSKILVNQIQQHIERSYIMIK